MAHTYMDQLLTPVHNEKRELVGLHISQRCTFDNSTSGWSVFQGEAGAKKIGAILGRKPVRVKQIDVQACVSVPNTIMPFVIADRGDVYNGYAWVGESQYLAGGATVYETLVWYPEITITPVWDSFSAVDWFRWLIKGALTWSTSDFAITHVYLEVVRDG